MASVISASTTSNTALNMSADTTGVLQLATGATPTTAVTIDTSQNVGIGTTSPYTKLQVYGVVRAATDNDKGVIGLGEALSTNQTVNCGFWRGGANSAVSTSTGVVTTGGNFLNMGGYDGIAFTTGAASIGSQTERMRIDSSGNVVFNNAVSTLPWLAGSGAAYGLRIGTTYTLSVNNSDITAIFNRTTSTGTLIEMKYNAGVVGSISVTGSATAYNTSSDYRLKENIVPMTGALDKVAQLKPVTFTWKKTGDDSQGFIAHELQAIVPDCVYGEKDAIDEEGNPKYQGVDTSFLVATLTAAIQEQQTIINDLKARIETLEAK